MPKSKYIIPFLIVLALVTACHYRPMYVSDGGAGGDSVCVYTRAYALNSNFQVEADTLWLHMLPFMDTVALVRGDKVVVAEFDIHPQDSVDSVWVKVARDQETIGWIQEHRLLENIVPVDPISRFIHFFSNVHTLSFFLVLAVFFLWFVYRAVRRKQIKLIWLNDIDSIFPLLLSLLMAIAATTYNSVQHFVPDTWERYYYEPSLNPFDVPFILGFFIVCVWLIVLVGVAVLDDLFHQAKAEVAFFYLVGLVSCCIFIYVFFTYVPVYLAYVCLIVYGMGCLRWFRKSDRYPYVCGACGAKLRTKGVCPHCGALNE